MKNILLFSILGLSAACGRSSHQDPDKALPLPRTVPLTVPVQLTQKDLSFGELTILSSYTFDNSITHDHQFILPVKNEGSHTLCYVSIHYKPTGETRIDLSKQVTYAETHLMNNDAFHSPCLAAGATGYFMSYATSSAQVLQGLDLLDASATIIDNVIPAQQVELVDQSISDSEIRVVFRNTSGHNLNPESLTRWLLRTPEKFLDWGFFNSEDLKTVAPGETFELHDDLYLGPLPPNTTLEFFTDFSEI